MKKLLIYLLGILGVLLLVSCGEGKVDESRIYHIDFPYYDRDGSKKQITVELYVVRPDGKDYPDGLKNFIKNQVKNYKEPLAKALYLQEDLFYFVPLSVYDVDVQEEINKYLEDNGYSLEISKGIDSLDISKYRPTRENEQDLYIQLIELGKKDNYFQDRYFLYTYIKNK